MSRRPALDGLRALAVLAVMAFHTSPAVPGGFLGVDVFFVLSGYLITAMLLAERARTGAIDLRRFYLRRALRLGPALLVMLVIAVPLMLTVLHQADGLPVWASVASALLYAANWANVAVDGGTGAITHTWSLSIEEQFYLIWPWVLMLALARRRGRAPARTLAVLALAVAAGRWVSWDLTHANWIYYATSSHSDGLLAGALLAIVLARRTAGRTGSRDIPVPATVPWWSEGAAVCGLAWITALMLTMDIHGGRTYRYGLILIVLATVPVVFHLAVADSGLVVRVLSLRPLVWIGTLSYGLYLFHFPIFQAVQQLQPGRWSHLVQHLLEVGLTLAVTLASWHFAERPALRLKAELGRERRIPRLRGPATGSITAGHPAVAGPPGPPGPRGPARPRHGRHACTLPEPAGAQRSPRITALPAPVPRQIRLPDGDPEPAGPAAAVIPNPRPVATPGPRRPRRR